MFLHLLLRILMVVVAVTAFVSPRGGWSGGGGDSCGGRRNSLSPGRPQSSSSSSSAAAAASRTRQFAVKATIRIVGKKTSDKWIEQGCQMYETRLRPNNIDLDTEWYKTNGALIKSVQSDMDKSSTPTILLDPLGKPSTSEDFSKMFYQWVEQGGSRLVFVIGGAEGLPHELRSMASTTAKSSNPQQQQKQQQKQRQKQQSTPIYLYSLSDLTFTHQFARLVLFEQIYRASEIVSREFLSTQVVSIALVIMSLFSVSLVSSLH